MTDAKKKKKKKNQQTDVSTSRQTYIASGLNAHQRAIAEMSTEQLANVISFVEEIGMPVSAILGVEEPPTDPNFVPRWPFKLGSPLVMPDLVNKLPTKMRRFHDWYMQRSKDEQESFGMLVRPQDFAGEGEKVIYLEFKDVYEVYHLDALNTNLIIAWCL